MKLEQRTGLRALLLAIAERFAPTGVTGRTRIQKLIFFASQRLALSVDYRPHYYGPYSDDVTEAVASLVARGLLAEDVQPLATEGPFEGRLYRYTLTDDGQAVLANLRKENPKSMERVDSVVKKLTKGAPPTQTLAVASKLDYVLGKSPTPARRNVLVKRARQFGWRIDPQHIAAGVDYLVTQGFVVKK